MPEALIDQAEGLRRLFTLPRPRTVALASDDSGAGRTTCVVNLAVALGIAGRRVLVIDENYGPCNVAGLLGLRARLDLQHAIRGDYAVEDVLVRGPEGVTVLPAANAVRSLTRLGAREQEHAIECFAWLDRRADLVLVDGVGGAATPFSWAAEETVVLVAPHAASITGAYAIIKRARHDGARRRFRVLVNRSQSGHSARVAFHNLSQVADSRLGMCLESIGTVPHDDAVARAAKDCRAVVEVFPDAPAAVSFRGLAARMLHWRATREHTVGLDSFMQKVIHSGRRKPARAGA